MTVVLDYTARSIVLHVLTLLTSAEETGVTTTTGKFLSLRPDD